MEELIKKLEEEIAALENELRIELAAGNPEGPRSRRSSENAEYHAAKERQGMVNARLGQLRGPAARDLHDRHGRIPRDRVGLGSTVTVLDLEKDEKVTLSAGHQRGSRRRQGPDFHQFADRPRLLGKQVGDTGEDSDPGRRAGDGDRAVENDSRRRTKQSCTRNRSLGNDIYPRDRRGVQQGNPVDRARAGAFEDSSQRADVYRPADQHRGGGAAGRGAVSVGPES